MVGGISFPGVAYGFSANQITVSQHRNASKTISHDNPSLRETVLVNPYCKLRAKRYIKQRSPGWMTLTVQLHLNQQQNALSLVPKYATLTIMASPTKKIIAIVGATGNQGGSVARTFLSLPEWHVRCLTRTPSSPASQALSSLGAEIIQADMDSGSSLSNAFQGAHAIFLNTDFWVTYRPQLKAQTESPKPNEPSASTIAFEREISHGKNAALAASKVPTLERLVYSALGPMKKLSGGKYVHSYHWESKAAIVDFIQNETPELAKKTSEIYLGAYNTNPLINPRLDPVSGKYVFISALQAETRIPIIDPTTSTGPFVRALIETEPLGTKLLAYDSYPSMREIVDIWCKATGKEASLQVMTLGQIHEMLKIPMEILDGVGFIEEFGYSGEIRLVQPNELGTKVETKSFEQWMIERDWTPLVSE